MKPTLFLSALLLLLHIITTRTQSPDDENKLYNEFLRINSTYTHSHVVSTDQIFWWSVSGTKIYIAVSGPGSDYVAAGFSPSGDMVGSVAVIGINSDIANISVYYLGGQSRSLVDHISSTNLVGSPVLTFLDGSLLLEFVWDTKGLNMHYNFSINDNVNMVWSWRSGFAYLDIHTGSTPSENPLNFQTGAGAKTYTTPKCGMGVPGNINGNVFQDPCQCRGFFQPPNCVKTNLTDTHTFYEGSTTIVTINWKVEKDIVNFDVLGDSDGWIGVGFCASGAGKMANMEAVLGWVDKATGTGNVVAKYVKSNRNLSPNELLPLTSTSAWIIDGTMGMHFSRKLSDGYNPLINGTAFMVAAKQVTSRPLPIVQHSSHSDSGVEINLINGTVTIPPYIWLPEYTHALLMYIAWGILFPFGILFARYSKHIKRAMWFEIHRVTQTTGFMVTCCGTVVAMLMVDGSHFNTAWHAQLGTAALSVMIYQICSALLRPHVEPKHRKTCQRLFFEWTHHILGRMGVIAAWVNIFAGFQQLGLSYVFVYAHAGVVGFWVILSIIFEIRLMLGSKRRDYQRVNS